MMLGEGNRVIFLLNYDSLWSLHKAVFFFYDFSDLKLKASLWADSEISQSFHQILWNLVPLLSSAQLHNFIHAKNVRPLLVRAKNFGTAVSLTFKDIVRYFGNNISWISWHLLDKKFDTTLSVQYEAGVHKSLYYLILAWRQQNVTTSTSKTHQVYLGLCARLFLGWVQWLHRVLLLWGCQATSSGNCGQEIVRQIIPWKTKNKWHITCKLLSLRGVGRWILLPLDKARVPVASLYAKLG